VADQRHRLGYRLRYALDHPRRVWPHLRRIARNAVIGLTRRDHVSFYREVMRRNVAEDPDLAIGSANRTRWYALGQMQLDYLVSRGLEPHHRMLEVGCGNLRGGWRFIDHLEPGHYVGVDISPDVLMSAQDTLVEFGLQDKWPTLTPVRDLRLAFLPSASFDLVHAHSVFSHTPLEVVDEFLTHVGRVLVPGGACDFTFNATTGREHHVVREDYYYRPATLLELARSKGLEPEHVARWAPAHKQDRIRALRPAG
jgi:protein-L-isoaspartate O-methyltransferase